MRLKVSDKSLFAVLLRSRWWVSIAVAIVIALLVRYFAPEEYLLPALSVTIPFLFTGILAAWKQLRVPGASRVASTVDAVSAMSWREFSDVMEAAFQRDGFAVSRISGAADLRLEKEGRVTLVSCKRWKAASHGVEPLRELETQKQSQAAHEALYVALGGVSENARRFAQSQKIRLVQDVELTALLRLRKGAKASA